MFSSNVFGTSFGNLWTGGSGFTGMSQLTCIYNKAFLITEYGWTYSNGQTYEDGSINEIWYNIIHNIDNGLIGGLYFEQTDEPVSGKNFGLYGVSVAYENGTNSTAPDAFIADAITPHQQ